MRWVLPAMVLSFALVAPTRAQDTSGLRVGTASFVVARYASVSSSNLYGGYSFGPAGLLFGMVKNPRSGYYEMVFGGVTALNARGQTIHLGAAVADASDGKYLQGYFVPSLSLGRFSLDATAEYYQPLDHEGSRQFGFNPLMGFVRIDRRIAIGVSYTLALQEGIASSQRLGPALKVAIPGATLKGEILRSLKNSAPEARLAIEAAFSR